MRYKINTDHMQNNEQTETIEFFKIRLMERDRQISDFEARMKKTEFKHSRDLKEAKIAEDRAKGLLKEEKAKVDKLTKQAKENQEQNQLLTLRLAELRDEKEREVSEIRSQYNSLKEEVRSYERILPTLTFMNEFNLRIAQIAPYEDIFLKAKEKERDLREVKELFEQFKKRTVEEFQIIRQNQELLKAKKVEIEKTLKEVLPRVVEYEQQICDLKTTNAELCETIDQLKQEVSVLEDKSQSLESTVREYELKLQELDRAYSCELLSKEEEIRTLTQEEFDRYESQIRSLQNRLQIKDNMYMQQVHILEEEVYFLQGRITEEKEHFQENYLIIKAEIDRMREQVESQRQEHDWLKSKHAETLNQLTLSKKSNDQLEAKIDSLQKKIAKLRQSQASSAKAISDVQLSKMEHLEQSYNQLVEKYEGMSVVQAKLEDENKALLEQVLVLRAELSNKTTPQSHTLDLPSHFLYFEQLIKRKSLESDRPHEEDTFQLVAQTSQTVKEGQRSSQIEIKLDAQKDLEAIQAKRGQYEEKIAQLVQNILKLQEQIRTEKKYKDQAVKENSELKKSLGDLTKQNNDNQQNLFTQSKHFNLLKNKAQALQKQNSLLCDEAKKDKQAIKSLREEQRQLKEQNNQLAEKGIREKKELNSQLDALRSERDSLKMELSTKQKHYHQELAMVQTLSQKSEKFQNQVQNLKKELETYKAEQKSLGKQCHDQLKTIEELSRQNEQLNQLIRQKTRKIASLQESLDRERKERTLVAVPSLEKFDSEGKEKAFNDIYAIVTQKESQIHFMEREISDLKEELESMRVSQNIKLEAMEAEQNHYIQTIIEMKVRCAESENKALQSLYLYSQLKKQKVDSNRST